MTFEDDLLALERRVLVEAAGDYLTAVAVLRRMVAMEEPGIARRLLALAVPDLEQQVRNGIEAAHALGAGRALDLLVEANVSRTRVEEIGALMTVPRALEAPVEGLSLRVAEAKTAARTLLQGGASAKDALSPVFQAATSVRSTIETQINAASNQAVEDIGRVAGQPMVWEAERDACVHCLALAGKVIQTSGDNFPLTSYGGIPRSFATISRPPRHPNCLPGDAVVTSGSQVTGASKRVYEGQMVRVRTLSGKELSATPNHPVLTDRGWVALGRLCVGDRVLSRVGGEAPIIRYNDGEHVPALIGEVAEAALSSSEMVTAEVPTTAIDFHGDGADGEIAHIASDLHLPAKNLSFCGEHRRELDFVRTVNVLPSSASRSSATEFGFSFGPAADSSVGRFAESRSLLWGTVRHALEHGSGSVAWFDASLEQAAADRPAADPEAAGDALLALAGEVIADELVSVEEYAFHGLVYNIETETGWYTGNGIIVHNCRCQLSILVDQSYADALEREAQRSILRGFSLRSESQAVRVKAAAKLLEDPTLVAPKSVKAVARKAVKEGKFPIRDVPEGDPRFNIR